MKTIKEYKQEFLKLANELGKDYGAPVSRIYITATESILCDRCDIEF